MEAQLPLRVGFPYLGAGEELLASGESLAELPNSPSAENTGPETQLSSAPQCSLQCMPGPSMGHWFVGMAPSPGDAPWLALTRSNASERWLGGGMALSSGGIAVASPLVSIPHIWTPPPGQG